MMKYAVFIVFSSLFLTGCPELGSHYGDESETLLVVHYKVQCDKDESRLCFRVREETTDDWEVFEEDFIGFSEFEWGYRYELTVNTSFDRDGHPESYELESVNQKDPVTAENETFSLTLYSDTGILQSLDDDTWSLNGDVSFACAPFCTDIQTSVSNGYVLQLEFTAREGALTLDSFICSSDEDGFSSECAGESEERWYIAHFLSDCGASEPTLCYLYKVNDSDEYELLPLEDGIEGFTYGWGSRYDIRVTKTVSAAGNITAADLLEDDSAPESRIGSNYTFLFVVNGEAVDDSSGGSFTMYDSAESFDCASYSQCSQIDEYILDDEDNHQPEWLLLKGYVDTADVVIVDIICHEEDLDDFRDCVADEDEEEDIYWGI